jgi:hypothetical protein
MSREKIKRREFIRTAAALTATVTTPWSFEEQALWAHQRQQQQPRQGPPGVSRPPVPEVAGPMPMGTLGGLSISRLIAGHNLVGATAHARDLIYVSQLLRNYFTDEKILETYQKYEEHGINAAFLRVEARQLRLAKRYREERGGKLQWIAQLVINEKDQRRDLDLALEVGARIAYIRGLETDRFFKADRLDVIASAIEYMRQQKVVVGVASHLLDSLIAVHRAGLDPDFYVKTFNSAQYWSAGPPLPPDPNWKPSKTELVPPEYGPPQHDNLWETTPKATAAWFATIDKPFVAYKVLAAGAIHPVDGFRYAFEHGADFISVGMYDFQIAEDVNITKALFAEKLNRSRPWRA